MQPTTSIKLRYLAAAVGSLFLVACGGGGSSTPATPAKPDLPPPPVVPPVVLPVVAPYTVSPSPLTAKYVAGFPATINVKATQSTTFVGIAYIKLSADGSVIESVKATTNADGSLDVKAATSATAAPGHYAGDITVNVCKDQNCTAQLEGAPFKVPYVIDVLSPAGGATASNVPPLAALAGATDWSGHQANAAHTGMVPVTIAPSAFTIRWKYEAPSIKGVQLGISDIVTGNGQLYFSTGPYWDSNTQGHQLFALKEQDGAQAWQYDFSSLRYPTTNPPAYANGKVYLSAGSQESTSMYGFDAASGSQLFSTRTSAQWPHYMAPVVFGDSLYSNGGAYGGMYAFDAKAGTQQWFASLSQVDGWTPAVDANFTYAFLGTQLQVNNRLTGASVSQITSTDSGWGLGLTPMIGGANSVIVASAKELTAFNLQAKSVRWRVDGGFAAGPAYDNKVVYALRVKPLAFEAHNEVDGSLAWSWTPPDTEKTWSGNVVLTNNLAFVSTATTTYAIDRTSHATVWTYPFGGTLSMSSNGVLYIKGQSSILAVNLK